MEIMKKKTFTGVEKTGTVYDPEYQKEYRTKHKAELKTYEKKYTESHKEEKSEYDKKLYEAMKKRKH